LRALVAASGGFVEKPLTCHSEEPKSDEESAFFLHFREVQIPRFARNDTLEHFFNKVDPAVHAHPAPLARN
jgi:hypothetical protein